MPYTSYSNSQLSKEVKKLRLALSTIVTVQFQDLLNEVEKRLSTTGNAPTNIKAKGATNNRRQTKQEIYNKYFYK